MTNSYFSDDDIELNKDTLTSAFATAPASAAQLWLLRQGLATRAVHLYAAVRVFQEVRDGVTAVRADELIAEVREYPQAAAEDPEESREEALTMIERRMRRDIVDMTRDHVEVAVPAMIAELLSLAAPCGLSVDDLITEARGRIPG